MKQSPAQLSGGRKKENELMDRRNFLKSAALGAGLLALPELGSRALRAQAAEITPAAELRLCSQDSRVPGANLREKAEKLKRWGASAIELGGVSHDRVAQIKADLKGLDMPIAALCWGSHKGDLVSLDLEKRKKGIADCKTQLEVAGELGVIGGVIHVPCFNKESQLKPEELDKILADILPEIGDHARKCGSYLLLEPLNKKETFYINRLEQAAAICKKMNNEGIRMMGDFYHMALEESDQTQAFVTAAPYLRHVHLATRDHRILPGQEPWSYVEGFKGIKKIGYKYYCSLECGLKKGTKADEEIPKAFAFLRQQWEEAKI